MSNEYQFTQDWFHWAPEVWTQLIPLLPERKKFLEIGSFEGRSTVWMMEYMLETGGVIDCIDTWEGGEEHNNGELSGARERFQANVALAMRKCDNQKFAIGIKSDSKTALGGILSEGVNLPRYDFIYIDGSHTAPDVLTDACMAWPLLKKDGLMVFDDYMWGNPRDALHRPKIAIDCFTNIFAERCDIIHVGYQAVVRKK